MSSSVSKVRKGIEEALGSIPGMRCYATVPDKIVTPAAIVVPESGTYTATYNRGSDDMSFSIQLVACRVATRQGQEQLDSFLDGAGDNSVIAALMEDETLGGVAHFVNVVGWAEYGVYDMAGEQFYGVTISVEVTCDGA